MVHCCMDGNFGIKKNLSQFRINLDMDFQGS